MTFVGGYPGAMGGMQAPSFLTPAVQRMLSMTGQAQLGAGPVRLALGSGSPMVNRLAAAAEQLGLGPGAQAAGGAGAAGAAGAGAGAFNPMGGMGAAGAAAGGAGGAGGGFNWASPMAGAGGARGLLGSAAKASPYFFGGQIAGGIGQSLGAPHPVNAALRGAGAGATIGTMINPGAGTAIGAALGGGLGALAGATGAHIPLITDSKSKAANLTSTNAKIKSAIKQLAPELGDQSRAALAAQLKATAALPTQQERVAARQQILAALPQLVGQEAQMRGQLDAQLRNQLVVGQLMAQLGQSGVQDANSYNAQVQALLPSLPEAYRGVAQLGGQQAVMNAGRMANAFTGSILADPIASAMQNQLSQLRQLQQQSQQQGTSLQSLIG